jgi:hypothetical protein
MFAASSHIAVAGDCGRKFPGWMTAGGQGRRMGERGVQEVVQ